MLDSSERTVSMLSLAKTPYFTTFIHPVAFQTDGKLCTGSLQMATLLRILELVGSPVIWKLPSDGYSQLKQA